MRPQAHHGYSVISLSLEDLTDLTAARRGGGVTDVPQGYPARYERWEAAVAAAHHLLVLREQALPASGERDNACYDAHEQFHAALLSGCSSRRLRATAQMLRAEAELYRHWAAPLGAPVAHDLAGEQRALADPVPIHAAVKGDELLRRHIACTTEILLSGLTTGKAPAA